MPARGFSLIEILVAISIIALLGIVAIPNLRKFSKDQEAGQTAAQIVNVLKTAQSSASSRIQCPKGEAASAWVVRFNTKNYSLLSKCQTPTIDLVPSSDLFSYAPDNSGSDSLFEGGFNYCNPQTQYLDIYFSKNDIGWLCGSYGPDALPAPLSGTPISLTIKQGNLVSKTIRIERGGIIKVE